MGLHNKPWPVRWGCALGLCVAVIPYVFTRGLVLMKEEMEREPVATPAETRVHPAESKRVHPAESKLRHRESASVPARADADSGDALGTAHETHLERRTREIREEEAGAARVAPPRV